MWQLGLVWLWHECLPKLISLLIGACLTHEGSASSKSPNSCHRFSATSWILWPILTMEKSLSWPRDAEVPAKWKPFCGWISILSSSWYVAAATLIAPAANASVDCSDRASSTSGMRDRREAQCLWWAGSWLRSVWSTSSYKVELLSLLRVVNTCFKSWCCIAIANSSGLCKLTTIHVGQSLIYCRGPQ